MTIDEIVSNFLRDAQYRVAEFTIAISDKKKEGYNYSDEDFMRAQLILWMDLLYNSRGSIYEGYNFLESWTDREIQEECEYLRKFTGMGEIPYLTFAGYSPEIRQIITGGGDGISFPSGNVGDILYYATQGTTPITTPFPQEGGMIGETIDEYFN
jgi:hypothetical protein